MTLQEKFMRKRTNAHDHVVDELLNIGRLVANSNLGQTREIHEREIQYYLRVVINMISINIDCANTTIQMQQIMMQHFSYI